MSKYCLFLIVIYYLTGGNNSMSRFCKFGKLHAQLKAIIDEAFAKEELDPFQKGYYDKISLWADFF